MLDLWTEQGVDCLEIDFQIDLGLIKEKVGDRTCLWRNIDPVGVMLKEARTRSEARVGMRSTRVPWGAVSSLEQGAF